MRDYCNFAPDGSYGHECGKPPVWARAVPSELRPGKIFWALRCQGCLERNGMENKGLGPAVHYDPLKHSNAWVIQAIKEVF